MKYFSLILFLSLIVSISFCSCKNNSIEPKKQNNVVSLNKKNCSYAASLKIMDSLKQHSSRMKTKTRGEVFAINIDTTIFPHWIGTPWDFNGYTNVPKTGEVACGYYVSTNLKHMGININRYKMAQQTSKNEVLSIDANPQTYNGDTKGFINYAHQHLSDGLYIIGMTSHVGMIQKQVKTFTYFILALLIELVW